MLIFEHQQAVAYCPSTNDRLLCPTASSLQYCGQLSCAYHQRAGRLGAQAFKPAYWDGEVYLDAGKEFFVLAGGGQLRLELQ